MTQYTNRIAFLAPIEYAEACNRAANALGRTGVNLSVPLSPTGQPPATHYGGSAVETDPFVQAVRNASAVTPEGVDPADWQAVVDHLIVVFGPASEAVASQQFAGLIAGRGLRKVSKEPPQAV